MYQSLRGGQNDDTRVLGDTYFLDEVFVKISGKQHYLWRALDQDGVPSLDGMSLMFIFKNAGMREQPNVFFRRVLRVGGMPREIVADKLRSYGVAHRSLTPSSRHTIERYANNRA